MINNYTKKEQIKNLWNSLAKCSDVTINYKKRKGEFVNVGFINQYALHEFIPNKWFDWENSINAKIMIIGQDWGPYSQLVKYVDDYNIKSKQDNFNYHRFLFSTFSSRTEKFIVKALENGFKQTKGRDMLEQDWKNFIFTVAIMFTRQGNHFRGSEFYDEKFGVKHSLPFLEKQIKIINPEIIVPLGGVAWNMVRDIFKINIDGNITCVINAQAGKPVITNGIKIIPNFHPASHTDPKIQLEIWKTVI